MIISRTPLRISFFGGGTDYPIWYRDNRGAVLATTINKYCYVTCRYLPPFFDHKWKAVYSRIEQTSDIDSIKHPGVRETLRFLDINDGVEMHHDGDLPARSGLGSSSAFTVGLLNALYALKGMMPSKLQLAREAIHIEQNMIEENVGSQDQTLAAYGGFLRIIFSSVQSIQVSPVIMDPTRLRQLQDHLMLVFTGTTRTASTIARSQITTTPRRTNELKAMHNLVFDGLEVLTSNQRLEDFGELLHQSWCLKRSLTKQISMPKIDAIYESARHAGAIGGKLLGAGGGGFMLLFVRPDQQVRVREHLRDLLHVPFSFETSGSEIIFYDAESLYRTPTEQKIDSPPVVSMAVR